MVFFHVFIAENCQKIGFPNLCRLFHKPFIRLYKKSYLGVVMTTEIPVEAVESFSGYACSYIGCLAKVLFRCRTIFFQLFLPSAIIFYDSHHLKNCFKCVSATDPQPLLSGPVTSGLRENCFSRVLSRVHGFLRIFFVFRSVFLYLTPLFSASGPLLH